MNEFTVTAIIMSVGFLAIILSIYIAYINLIKRINSFIVNQNENISSYTTNIQRQFNHIKLANIVSFSNEISQYKNGIYEDEHLIQEVGECKIFKIIDKKTNEITNIYYENNVRSFTETFLNSRLLHKMYYSKDGFLVKGEDFGKTGKLTFSYEYDGAGEISTKIEYIYDDNDNIINEIKKEY